MSRAEIRVSIISMVTMLALSIAGPAFAQGFPGGVHEAFGSRFHAAPHTSTIPPFQPNRTDIIGRWNEITIDASGLDHTPVAPGDTRVFGEQFGPTRASRAVAIVQIAVFDAVNAIVGGYHSYTGITPVHVACSIDAAVAQAAHDTLVAMFPSQTATFDTFLAQDLSRIKPNGTPKTRGINLGKSAAAAILALRANDGSAIPEPKIGVGFFTSNDPGKWRKDPIGNSPLALGAFWGEVTPFAMQSSDQFRVPPPPALTSPEYTAAYDDVKAIGGDGNVTPSTRTTDQTDIGIFWAYDGTPSLCAPPRLYNQILLHLADQLGTSKNVEQFARLLAVANVAMADAGIAIWESKYFYQYWRPITGIRESDPGTGPSMLGDGNPDTAGDTGWMPLGAPASNLAGPNFTPPFPSYPSGHGGFGGALFETLRLFYGTDNISFTIVSDELNGVTKDHNGNIRPLLPRSYTSFSQAMEENGQSRIYLGIHWSFDKTEAIAQGKNVADYVFAHAFTPVH
ncbi:MAG TPA: vanadium-dependent haloperoxidase [Candidatus Acidoferrales bacterium]|nr:vanadium-dependent haloperoxidase [Candidatus Acidoferrales bacterium]